MMTVMVGDDGGGGGRRRERRRGGRESVCLCGVCRVCVFKGKG